MAHDRKFRFAIQLTHSASGEEWKAMARRAEESGFAVLSLPDHLGEQFSPIPALSAAAAVTRSIRLGMFVLTNDLRHPGVLAKEIATLDMISGGRVELGMGAGWTRTEFEALGIPFDPPGTRIDRLAEAVTILRAAFTRDAVSFSGKHYTVTDLVIRPRPAQAGGIPIVLGGGGKKMLSLAAREADIVGISSNNRLRPSLTSPLGGFALARVREQARWVREAAGARFGDLELNCRILAVAVAPERETAARELGASLGVPSEDLLGSPFAFIGTIPQLEDQLRRMRDELGVSYYTISQRHAGPLLPLIERLSGR